MRKQHIHNDFIVDYERGMSIAELCRRFGICKSTAYNWIREYSPVKRTKGRTITAHDYYQLERENRTLRIENEMSVNSDRIKICSEK